MNASHTFNHTVNTTRTHVRATNLPWCLQRWLFLHTLFDLAIDTLKLCSWNDNSCENTLQLQVDSVLSVLEVVLLWSAHNTAHKREHDVQCIETDVAELYRSYSESPTHLLRDPHIDIGTMNTWCGKRARTDSQFFGPCCVYVREVCDMHAEKVRNVCNLCGVELVVWIHKEKVRE